MTTSTTSASIEIDVPVETVFALISDLERFMGVVPAIDRVVIRDVDTSDDGATTSYAWTAGTAIGPLRAQVRGRSTREQLVPSRHLVYRHAMGLHTVEELTLERTASGARLRFTGSVSSPIPGLDRLWVLAASKGKGHSYYVDLVLAAIKRELEAGPDKDQPAGHQASDPPLTAVGRLMKKAFSVPSGPLGWISTRVLVPLLVGPVYQDTADALQLGPDDELLDVGCGSGAFLARHASRVRRVAGIDLSDLQIELARRTLGDRIAAGTADIVTGDAASLPWPDGSFTVVTSMESFAVFPDPEQVLAEMFRVLRPGGRAVLNIGEGVPAGTPTQRRWGLLWLWADDEVQRMVERAGFSDVSMHYTAAWGDDPMSKLVMRLMDRLGAQARDLRFVSATKQYMTSAPVHMRAKRPRMELPGPDSRSPSRSWRGGTMVDDLNGSDRVRAAVLAYHDAFEARDVDAIVAAFAPDGQVTASPGTFRGPEGLRIITEWAVDVSPTASVRDTGGTIVSGRTAIWEGEISEQYDGIDYTYPIVEVFEFDEDLKIMRKHNYYDKLAILRQIATALPGAKGMAYRLLLRVLSAGDAEPSKPTT